MCVYGKKRAEPGLAGLRQVDALRQARAPWRERRPREHEAAWPGPPVIALTRELARGPARNEIASEFAVCALDGGKLRALGLVQPSKNAPPRLFRTGLTRRALTCAREAPRIICASYTMEPVFPTKAARLCVRPGPSRPKRALAESPHRTSAISLFPRHPIPGLPQRGPQARQ